MSEPAQVQVMGWGKLIFILVAVGLVTGLVLGLVGQLLGRPLGSSAGVGAAIGAVGALLVSRRRIALAANRPR